MKLFIFHGPGITAMTNRILTIKKSYDSLNIKEFYGKETTFEKANLELSNLSLFSENRLAILRDFSDIDLDKLPQDEHLSVIIQSSKSLASNSVVLKSAAKLGANVMAFTEAAETSVFPLLDYLAEKDPQALRELDKVYKEYGGQYILTMLFYLLRRYVIPQTRLPDFARRKLDKQRANFSTSRLKFLYKSILETDFKIKSGILEEKMGLSLLAEQFLNN